MFMKTKDYNNNIFALKGQCIGIVYNTKPYKRA